MKNLGNLVAHLTLAVLILMGSVIAYWTCIDYRMPAIEVISDPITLPHQVQPGEEVLVQWQIKQLRSCPGALYRGLTNSEFTLPLDHAPMIDQSEHNKLATLVKIPTALPPGRYALVVTGYFQCNPLRSTKVAFPDAQLSVVPLGPKA